MKVLSLNSILLSLVIAISGCTGEILNATEIAKIDAASDKAACDDDGDCVPDCLGEWGGDAYLDACGQCVGGNSGAQPCRCGDGKLDLELGETCDDGNEVTEVCPYGVRECTVCNETCRSVSGAVEFCGDGTLQEERGEVCDDGNNRDDDYCAADCSKSLSVCGDGEQAEDEACDDGNLSDDDYCSSDCLTVTSVCGDGQMQGDEACDDGNTVDGDYCSANCRRETSICGDGIRQLEEMCDDGNTVTELCDYGVQACTVCTSTCEYKAGSVRYCGDGVVQTAFESCDEAPREGGCDYGPASCFQCTAECAWQEATPRFCGDGIVDAEEECDDGNTTTETCAYGEESCSICNPLCKVEVFDGAYCGNGRLESDEVCDDGNTSDGDYCSADCTAITTVCGDGLREGEEACDDGNVETEICAYGVEACVVCNHQCEQVEGAISICGDGVTAGPETCDDGNAVTEVCTYGQPECQVCNAECQWQAGETFLCGDGVINEEFEECDDGNLEIGDYCSNFCKHAAVCGDGFIGVPALDGGLYEDCDDGDAITNDCPYGVRYCDVCGAAPDFEISFEYGRYGCSIRRGITSYCGDGIVDAANGEACDDGDYFNSNDWRRVSNLQRRL